MKKNTMMRLASALLVLVLLTTCAISGTFAKYVSSNTGNDSARVAYWGWTPTALAIDMFDGEYDVVGDSATVDNANDDNLVAPGTSKTTTFAFAYTPKDATVNALTAGAIAAPEVDYTFTVDAAITGDYDALDANPNFYWTLKAPSATEATKYQTVAELIAAVKLLSGEADGSCDYKHGTLPTGFTDADEEYTIGWEWLFETADNTQTTDKNEMALQDATDTAMGNAQDLDDVTFTITITATQIN